MNIRCVKSKANPDNKKFGISYTLLLNPYLFKTDEISINKLQHLKLVTKLSIDYVMNFSVPEYFFECEPFKKQFETAIIAVIYFPALWLIFFV